MGLTYTDFKLVLVRAITILFVSCPLSAESWPDLSTPARPIGGGRNDAAIVVGIQNYSFVPQIPGAEENAKGWYDYLTKTRGVPPENVKLLMGVDGTREEILDAATKAASNVGSNGTLWFIFIGHGAPSPNGKDGLLVGVDAQQKASSLSARSVGRDEILRMLAMSKAAGIHVLLDACFSGRTYDGAAIAPGIQPLVAIAAPHVVDSRMVVFTAAKGDQYAGSLPGLGRPAFSYLTLGGIRGWASENGRVTAGSLMRYAQSVLKATLRGRNQTPEISGTENAVVSQSAGEVAPDLGNLAKATTGGAGDAFVISDLPKLPKVSAPATLQPISEGADWRTLDVDSLEKYDSVMKFDKSSASPDEKARRWRALGKAAPKYAEQAAKRAVDWDKFALDLAEAEKAREKRLMAMESDWTRLNRLLGMSVVPDSDKRRWAQLFVEAYGNSSDENPFVDELQNFMPKGSLKIIPGAAKQRLASRGGIEWVTIPGGRFAMGSVSDDEDESPVHSVTIETFQLAKTEVTFEQYAKCVASGYCSELSCSADDSKEPVFCADWEQAVAFSQWVGGRLPSESEWEYAARGGSAGNVFPWGNEMPSCRLAALREIAGYDCRLSGSVRVCSYPRGTQTETGLCDMAGNVWEWVQDTYHSSYANAPIDGGALEDARSGERVIRGGAWDSMPAALRASNRGRAPGGVKMGNANLVEKAFGRMPGNRIQNIGFRPARNL